MPISGEVAALADDRLTGLDASFLHLEDDRTHMHVAAVMTFDGEAPDYEQFREAIGRHLHLVPRYRQKLAFVPFGQGRPRWVDDPHLNLDYHVRSTALPEPGTEDQLRALAGRVFSQRLDRDKPLWELWVVEGLDGGERFAVLSKTHHALVDGISGVDIMSVLFDASPEPAPAAEPARPAAHHEASPDMLYEQRSVHGVPTNADMKVARAIELFNGSEHTRTVAGVARSLGAPIVSARPSKTEGSVVTIVVAWELSWYRFEVDLGNEAAGVRVAAQGSELAELDTIDQTANAAADELGRLHPAASLT
jgi:WS/DGAT/MGAT family acyltransferase